MSTAPAVEIIRDAQGIPHISADSAAGALFGQGYACGVDRAWQIEYLRLRAEGRTAEIVGAVGVSWDEFARRARIDAAARRIFEASSERTRSLVRAYVDGVNSSLDTADALELTEFDHRPTPWQPWTPISIFIVHHILFGRFTTKLWRLHACQALGRDALRLFDCEGVDESWDSVPALPDEAFLTDVLAEFGAVAGAGQPDRTSFGEPLSGSNAWGVAAAHTAGGAPLIAGDPHRFLELPGIYQQVHLAAPEFDVVGFAFAGVPAVPHFAHAGPVAWGITNAMGDYQDLFFERLTRRGTDVLAESADGPRVATTHREDILVRDGDPVSVEIIGTGNGSVVFGGPEAPFALSLRTPLLDDANATFDAALDLLFARSVPEVEQALIGWVEPANRIVVADAEGRLTRHVVGAVPVRAPENYWLPVPGWDARYRWRGQATASVSDTAFDANVGSYAVIANQRVSDAAPLQPVTTECAAPDRAQRIAALLDRALLTSDRTHMDRADVGRTDVDRADVDRADVGRADVGRADVDRADADRVVGIESAAAQVGTVRTCAPATAAAESARWRADITAPDGGAAALKPAGTAEAGTVTVDDCADIHRDVVSEGAETLLSLLDSLTGLTPTAERVRARLLAWDRTMAAESTDAYVFAEVRTRLVSAIARHEALAGLARPHGFPRMFDPWFVVETRLGAALDSVLRHAPSVGVDITTVAAEALEAVAAHLAEQESAPTWGSVHVLQPIHGMDLMGATPAHPELSAKIRPARLPLGGDGECVMANASAIGFSHACSLGSAARYIWDLADRDASRWIVPLGVSGDPRSDHFQDQAPLWARGDLVGLVGDWQTLRAHARKVDVFTRVPEQSTESVGPVDGFALARAEQAAPPQSTDDSMPGEA
ncbi:penicillin acylase family protein [Nocardia higoensis]|uniref:Penicillin acylase family protein n=1 Tax=Nocardia higoensis TaxID=228599 RepID=A0ABS0D6E7_9NOCA|nr:penicillin acylase family protein [Nocardia higoensis]MBF6354049.1 penicillin acylase family protein [Nocardia higoensis]